VLRPGGRLAFAFKGRDSGRDTGRTDLDVYWCSTEVSAGLLVQAGFAETVRVGRAAGAHERQRRGYLVMSEEDRGHLAPLLEGEVVARVGREDLEGHVVGAC
jgi:hypothetical protein